MNTSFEENIVDEGQQIFKALDHDKQGFFDKNYWFGRLMEWVMKDQTFKVDLFRFVDVLPMLSTNEQISKHVKEYLLKDDRDIPLVMNTALRAASLPFAKGLAATAIRKNVTEMAQRFIAGVHLDDAKDLLHSLSRQGFRFTIDLLGEKTLSDQEADRYLQRYLSLIDSLPTVLKHNSSNATSDNLPNISLKVSALSCNLREEDPQASVDDLKKRILPVLRAAKSKNVFINFDVETHQTREIIYLLFSQICLSDEFRLWPHLGIVLQAYLRNSDIYLRELLELTNQRGVPITVRLVKGAYWDYEVVKAESLGHQVPVYLNKAETDLQYEKLSRGLLDCVNMVRPAFASHNIRSLAHAITYAKSKDILPSLYEIQTLYGMAEAERKALLSRGHQVRIYMPIGEILPGMSYLVRRLLENTSQMGFLKLNHHDRKNETNLLTTPVVNGAHLTTEKSAGFRNIGVADFTSAKLRHDFQEAIDQTDKSLPREVLINISGKDFATENKLQRISPNDLQKNVCIVNLANIEHVDKAVDASFGAFPLLSQVTLGERASHLNALAKIMEEDRFTLAAIMCFEVGKTWTEADADVAEAIDFCNYYAERALTELSPHTMGSVGGEQNILSFQGRGPTAIIAPWNFPLAILCGMSVAAYVAGNPIIIKPSELSCLTARMLFDRMHKAGFVKQAIHFLPGVGEDIGPRLVSHPRIANICFTGSMTVGHSIMKAANTVQSDQIQMKRVICEMGGKNTIVVDEDADLDEAVNGIIVSAFGYAGQKCSAASRVVAIGTIKDQLIARLVEAANSLHVDHSIKPSTFMGPVVDHDAYERLKLAQEKLSQDPSITVIQTGQTRAGGYFVPIMIVTVNDANHWVMQDELFGPIVAIYHSSNLEHAINVANGTKYALTGAFFSRSPENIGYARKHFSVGNLYINQKCTGALVQRQPFGGYKMSGTGIKAGGPHYLLNLVDTKLVSENTMRRGFTPEVSL